MSTVDPSSTGSRRPVPAWALGGGVLVVAVAGLIWAKWAPYWAKVPSVADSGSLGTSILTGGGAAPPGVSLTAGLEFAADYFLAIWPALVVGLVLAAAVRAALPGDWVRRLFGGRGTGGAVRGGALAVPSMMCSCCAAPVAVGLRQRAASTTATLTYWLANPALNPVVLAFCAFVLPWPWTVLRAGAGLAVVAGAVVLARRADGDGVSTTRHADGGTSPTSGVRDSPSITDEEAADGRSLPRRFLTALASVTLRLLPEYLLLVVALGALRGVLFPLGSPLVSGTGTLVLVVGVVVLAVAGTLLPIPTGAEVAIVAAMLAVGVSAPVAAALLITLPVLSLPSLLMVRRVFPARVLTATTGLVVVVGLLTSAVAWAAPM